MTQKEITGIRDLQFSQWVREKLPDSKFGFMVTDLDFILENYKTKKIMLLEVKIRNKRLSLWQKMLFENLNRWTIKGIDEDWQYLGFHIIKFENTNFDDGKVFFDDELITENELIEKISF